MLKTIRIVLICVVLVAMGGIGYTQVDWSKVSLGGGAAKASPSMIKSTSTGSRVGGDKTITIQRKKPGFWMQLRMMLGYKPKDAHKADLQRLQKQREGEAARSKGVNSVTGRRESTAAKRSTSTLKKQATTNRSLSDALN
ncbi:hypothetical protein IV417_08820 [Alphaproteobacteria bacterium KMM 3653]|uniref:Uncharacterized protein n=1 Tax=Harenicola maris TaxID=2841044 RepID=A0AAP2CP37_9RHOB|nr:hypothetical protein [Harenicola maris]